MPHSHTRILVVDDEPAPRGVLAELLRLDGYLVELAATGTAAWKMVQESPPDLVLTELNMPELDGIGLCRRVHDVCPDLPVVVVTAMADMTSALAALRAGAEDYLMKPLDIETLLLTLERATQRRAVKVEREQLRARTEELHQQTLSAARAHQEVLSIVSHDLRNPLGVVIMAAHELGLVAASLEHAQVVQTIAASILRNSNTMQRLIADLLDESRIRTGHLALVCEAHSLSQLLADTLELRALARQKRMRIQIVAPAQEGLVTCDRLRMGQVLGNLIGNAIKFGRENSTVTVSSEQANGEVTFSVRDEGVGIPAEALPKIFDQFWQARAGIRSGVGLGLYIVKGIVEAHGGRIWVESELGVGSTFHVHIPSLRLEPRQPTGAELPGGHTN